jgi:hypothetical protein
VDDLYGVASLAADLIDASEGLRGCSGISDP